jgi:hypothetical protein
LRTFADKRRLPVPVACVTSPYLPREERKGHDGDTVAASEEVTVVVAVMTPLPPPKR